MTPTDAGPLFVLFNRKDVDYKRCLETMRRLPPILLTTWPCFTEAMYLLGRDLGYRGQDALWSTVEKGVLQLHSPSDDERARMRVLMVQYRDTPMDLADASLVALCESLSFSHVFTLDKHFYAYRTGDGRALQIVP